jgi:hypothetical protein
MSPSTPFLRRGRSAAPPAFLSAPESADLSNRKLAHNQTELSNQITELRGIVEAQGQLIARLVSALEGGDAGEGKGKARARDDIVYS